MSDYHARIMNIPANGKEMDSTAYRMGHRDARHAAAEIALEAENEVERLREALRVCYALTSSTSVAEVARAALAGEDRES